MMKKSLFSAALAALALAGCASLNPEAGSFFDKGAEASPAAQKKICADMAGGLAKIYSPAFTRLAMTFSPAEGDSFSASCIAMLRTAGFEVKEMAGKAEPAQTSAEIVESGSAQRKDVSLAFVLDRAGGYVRATLRPDGRSMSRIYSADGVPASAWAVQGR